MSSAHSNSKLINLLQQHHNCVESLQVLDVEELDTNKEPCHFDL